VSPVSFLLIALFIAAAGIAIAVMRSRKPSRPENAMESFRREMQALAPHDQPEGGRPEPKGIIWTANPDHSASTDVASDAEPSDDEQ
jgi:hypothetical protein